MSNENKTTKELILERIANGPTTWTEILELTRITKPALYQHLQELQSRFLIIKDQESKYILTKEGRKYLKKLRLMQLFSEMLDILLEEK